MVVLNIFRLTFFHVNFIMYTIYMQIFKYIYLLVFLWFHNDVKASVSIDSSPNAITIFISTFKEKGSRNIHLPFSSKINFRTFYNFDLGFRQEYEIYLARWEERILFSGATKTIPPKFVSISASKRYCCKNEATSFVPTFYFCLSKRKEIKKIFERVDLCFDFSLSLLYFKVALITKDGESFKFFHLAESANENEQKERGWRPFRFSFECIKRQYYSFLLMCGYNKETIKNSPHNIESVDKYFSFLFWLASCFEFSFDIRICSYLFCCIKIPIKSVFELFFLFRYLFLKKKCEELLEKYKEENARRGYMADGEKSELGILLDEKQEKRDSMLVACKSFSLAILAQTLNFSIRF